MHAVHYTTELLCAGTRRLLLWSKWSDVLAFNCAYPTHYLQPLARESARELLEHLVLELAQNHPVRYELAAGGGCRGSCGTVIRNLLSGT